MFELFSVKKLDKIPFAENPKGPIIYITPEEFEQKFHCRYSESPWVSKNSDKQKIKKIEIGQEIGVFQDELEQKIADRIHHPFQDFVICPIDNEVGYGLFATVNIPKNTLLGLYSGRIVALDDMGQSNLDNADDYLLCDRKHHFVTSSNEVGGFVRFMQHLPIDHKKYANNLFNDFQNLDFLAKVLAQKGSCLSPQELAQLMQEKRITDDQIRTLVEQGTALNKAVDNELEEIDFRDPATKFQVATRNVSPQPVKYKGYTVTAMITQYDVHKGQQIGFSYGKGYWDMKGVTPRLFDIDGTLLPLNSYKRQHYSCKIPTTRRFNGIFSGSTSDILDQIKSGRPLQVATGNYVSAYDFREHLSKANVVDPERYAAIQYSNSFARHMQERFEDLDIRLYFQKPETDSWIVDAVCRTKNSEQFSSLQRFFHGIKRQVRAEETTQEIIVRDINGEHVQAIQKLF